MDRQQGIICSKEADILDFSILQSSEAKDSIKKSNAWLLNMNDDYLKKSQARKNEGFSGAIEISKEEMKIRKELEMDVERDLEAEIKDGIYHLALRLHRLYQHRKERKINNKVFCDEVIISIKMEGGTKIEIKETKRAATTAPHHQKGCPPQTSTSRSSENYMQPLIMQMATNNHTKKLDWPKTLRSSTAGHPVQITKKINGTKMGWKV